MRRKRPGGTPSFDSRFEHILPEFCSCRVMYSDWGSCITVEVVGICSSSKTNALSRSALMAACVGDRFQAQAYCNQNRVRGRTTGSGKRTHVILSSGSLA